MTRRVAALALAAVLAVPACTTRTGGPAHSASPTSTAAVTTTATTTTTTTSAAPVPTSAKDGTNVAACRDGVCEVRLTKKTVIPVDPATGITVIAVETITGDELNAAITLAGTSVDMNCTGDPRCQTSGVGTSPPAVFATAHPGAHVLVNKVELTIPAAADGVAILRLGRR
jgi:hypothetical protein